MTDEEVLQYKNHKKENGFLCCEVYSGDKCRIVRISLNKGSVVLELSDGTTAKPETVKTIQAFTQREIVNAQKYLLSR